MKVITILFTAPLFWAMQAQQNTSWIFQGRRLENIISWYTIYPDQMAIFNTVFLFTLIPIFKFIYLKCNTFFSSPLKRMVLGQFFIIFSFTLSAALSWWLEETNYIVPSKNQAQLNIYNNVNCTLYLKSNVFTERQVVVENMSLLKKTISPISKSIKTMCNYSCGNEANSIILKLTERKCSSYYFRTFPTLKLIPDEVCEILNENTIKPMVRTLINSKLTPVYYYKTLSETNRSIMRNLDPEYITFFYKPFTLYINHTRIATYNFRRSHYYAVLVNDLGNSTYVRFIFNN